MTDKPAAERLLKAFSNIALTIIKKAADEEILRSTANHDPENDSNGTSIMVARP